MGVVNHNAIIATTWSKPDAELIIEWVNTNARNYTGLFTYSTNEYGFTTIVMNPDGSKEGWEDSNNCDRIRDELIAYLDTFTYSDDSSSISYVEVSFGEYGQKIVRGNRPDNKYAP